MKIRWVLDHETCKPKKVRGTLIGGHLVTATSVYDASWLRVEDALDAAIQLVSERLHVLEQQILAMVA